MVHKVNNITLYYIIYSQLSIIEDLFSNIINLSDEKKEVFFEHMSNICHKILSLTHNITKKFEQPIMLKVILINILLNPNILIRHISFVVP